MLIHTEGTVNAHENDQKEIQKHLSVLIQEKQPQADRYVQYMYDFSVSEIQKHKLGFTPENVLSFILEYIGSATLVINHKSKK